MQVSNDTWKTKAHNITHSQKSIQPSRGLIYDRNGVLMVGSEPAYDIWVVPNRIGITDTTDLLEIFDMPIEEFRERIWKARKYASYASSIFLGGVSDEDYSRISPRLRLHEAFKAKLRNNRGYPLKSAAHVLGYIRAISEKAYKEDQAGEGYYHMNDHVGITGLEKIYEKELRGQRGNKVYLKDKHGEALEDVELKEAVAGSDLYSTLDANLQYYGEQLMNNKVGCIVAIEPATGEILSMVSAPNYDPNSFVGRNYSKNYSKILADDTLKPIINRPVYNDSYRPGSIFKLIQALVAMQEGVITANSGFACTKTPIGCHNHEHPSNVKIAIKHSCNPYFYQVYKRLIQRGESNSIFKDAAIGLDKWSEAIKSFGLGVKLGTDIPGVKSGNIPDANYYDNEFPPNKPYGKHRWALSTIRSNSIGEGEIGVAPLQMANLAAILANRGYYYTPHLVKKIGEEGSKRPEYLKKNFTVVDARHFPPVIDAMEMVVQSGTGRSAQVDSVSVCGKTGTVQNGEGINDHSVFIAFAPKENPQIAVAVYVEWGTWGGTWAAPIASLMIEKYLKKTLSERGKRKEQLVKDAYILTPDSDFKKPVE